MSIRSVGWRGGLVVLGWLGLWLLAALPVGCGGSGPRPTPAEGDVRDPPPAWLPDRHRIVVLSIDGCRPDALEAAGARNLLEFGARGARAMRALTIPLSLTLPSHSSMLSGFSLEGHGVDWNGPIPERGYIKVPTIFNVAHAAGQRTIMVMGKDKFLTLLQPNTLDEVHELAGDEDAIMEQAIWIARKGNFDLMFVHLPNPDITGHVMGWMSAPYLAKIAHIDQLFSWLLQALPSDATVIVTADHGGHDLGHGTDTEVDRHIPWMIDGPRIKKGVVVARDIATTDTAATALHLLGLAVGAAGAVVPEGQVVHEVLAD
jgi:predicted AlkP superfamily pyrophosphatase or phosphodiesterase